jgi:hypothetical protein
LSEAKVALRQIEDWVEAFFKRLDFSKIEKLSTAVLATRKSNASVATRFDAIWENGKWKDGVVVNLQCGGAFSPEELLQAERSCLRKLGLPVQIKHRKRQKDSTGSSSTQVPLSSRRQDTSTSIEVAKNAIAEKEKQASAEKAAPAPPKASVEQASAEIDAESQPTPTSGTPEAASTSSSSSSSSSSSFHPKAKAGRKPNHLSQAPATLCRKRKLARLKVDGKLASYYAEESARVKKSVRAKKTKAAADAKARKEEAEAARADVEKRQASQRQAAEADLARRKWKKMQSLEHHPW